MTINNVIFKCISYILQAAAAASATYDRRPYSSGGLVALLQRERLDVHGCKCIIRIIMVNDGLDLEPGRVVINSVIY